MFLKTNISYPWYVHRRTYGYQRVSHIGFSKNVGYVLRGGFPVNLVVRL